MLDSYDGGLSFGSVAIIAVQGENCGHGRVTVVVDRNDDAIAMFPVHMSVYPFPIFTSLYMVVTLLVVVNIAVMIDVLVDIFVGALHDVVNVDDIADTSLSACYPALMHDRSLFSIEILGNNSSHWSTMNGSLRGGLV